MASSRVVVASGVARKESTGSVVPLEVNEAGGAVADIVDAIDSAAAVPAAVTATSPVVVAADDGGAASVMVASSALCATGPYRSSPHMLWLKKANYGIRIR